MQVRAQSAPRLLGGAPQELGEHVVALGEVPVSAVSLVRMAALARIVAIISSARRRLLHPRGVDLAGVEPPPLVRIGKQIVGGGDLLELFLGALVARVEVGVKLLASFRVGGAKLVGGRGLGDAKNLIGVSHALIRGSEFTYERPQNCMSSLKARTEGEARGAATALPQTAVRYPEPAINTCREPHQD